MEATCVGDDLLAPEEAQHLDLLLVLNRVPAHTNTEAKFAAGEDIDFGCLFGHEHRLPLRQDDDSWDQFQMRQGCQVAKQYERLMKHATVGIALPTGTVLRVRTQDVVKSQQVAVPQTLGSLRIVANGRGVRADLVLWESDSYLHGENPF